MKNFRSAVAATLLVFIISCTQNGSTDTPTGTTEQRLGAVTFANYIELDKISQISKFRSGIGHDYWDDAEQRRSMKHYFVPKENVNWSSLRIFSPVSGTIVRLTEEWAGTQVQVQSADGYVFILFHVKLAHPLVVGEKVAAGDTLGTHIGSQTYSDIAVGHSVNNAWRLVSYFDVMPDSIFQFYKARGISTRADCIISKEARDADPLNCTGDTFGTQGTISNWIILN